jgi:hypothetical protein
MLWGLISVHVVGGAILFRRLFPRESPWLGFVVPEIVFLLLMNLVEHNVAVPFLRALLPFSSIACAWLMIRPQTPWRVLRLPSLLFIGVFAFTLTLRMLKPSIADIRDGIIDLSLISNFCMGQTLPVDSTWIPPVKFIQYYGLGHYGASLVIRLLGLDMGTGYNVCAALVSAYIYFLAGAVAWHVSRGKLWITLLAPVLIGCAGTGSTAYLWFSIKDLNPEDTANLYTRMNDPQVHIWLWKYLTPIDFYDSHELLVPGYWSWMGCFHSATIGQFLTAFSILCLLELLRRKRTNWPWICLVITPLLMLLSCAWGTLLAGVFMLCGLGGCWRMKIAPQDWRFVLMVGAGLVLCLVPMLTYFLTSPMPECSLVVGQRHTQWAEFLVQWWPIYIPWLALLFIWKRLSPAVRIIHVVTPLAFLGVELYNFGARFDMTGKFWGFIFGAAWLVFFPVIAAQRAVIFRFLLVLLMISSGLSFCFWVSYYWRCAPMNDVAQLDGRGPLRWDQKKAKLLEAVSHMNHQIIMTGKSGWAFCQGPMLANLTYNSDYVTWSFDCDIDVYRNGQGEGYRREVEMNNFYDGKNDDPFIFLRQRNIAAVVVWPDDNMSDAVLLSLRQRLEPYYEYSDFRDGDPPGPPNAGIFIYHPEMISLIGPPAAQTSGQGVSSK